MILRANIEVRYSRFVSIGIGVSKMLSASGYFKIIYESLQKDKRKKYVHVHYFNETLSDRI